jgi:hypothetical protein
METASPQECSMRRRLAALVVLALLLPTLAAAAAGETPLTAGLSTRPFGDDGFFGSSLGLAWAGTTLHAAWTDNSATLPGNPDGALEIAATSAADAAGGTLSPGPTINVSRLAGGQASASLAVDPTRPGRIVIAADTATDENNVGVLVAVSEDGGATWRTSVQVFPGPGARSARVAFDRHGNLFLAFVDTSSFFSPELRVRLSTDGGSTFSELPLPSLPGFELRPALVAGGDGVWVAFESITGTGVISTLSAPVAGLGQVGTLTLSTLPGSGSATSSDIAVLSNGRVLVSAERLFGDPPSVDVWTDPDGLGPAGFGSPLVVTNIPGYPTAARPRLAGAPSGGRGYLVYEDGRFGDPGFRDVFLRFSDDGGATWSAAIRSNGDARSVDRLIPAVAVASGGAVATSWYDFRNGDGQPFARVFPSLVAPPEPGSPVNLRATGVSRSRIDLSWLDRSNNETGFEIRRISGSPLAPTIVTFTVGAGVTSFSDTGLPEDSGFSYVLRAFNGAGFSTPANTAAATTLDTPPSAPTNLVAIGVSFQRIDLRWDPADDPDGYEIQQSLDATSWTSLGRGATPTTSAMLFGLQPDTTYFFRVRAFNSGGDGPFSNVASARTEVTPPIAPSGLTAVGASTTRIDLSWTDRSPNETRFEIDRAQSGRPFKHVATAPENAVFFTDTRLKANTTYTYQVRACNSLGCSVASNPATATTLSR